MHDSEKLGTWIHFGGTALAAIVGALCFRAIGNYMALDLTGQVIFLIGGTFLGAGLGSITFGFFRSYILAAIDGKVRAIVIITLSAINALVSYRVILSATDGNQVLSILGSFASFIAPAIVIGYAIEIVKGFRG